MQANQYLARYYGNYDEDGRLVSRHGAVEFLTTMRYIEKYAKPGDRILEVGTGTGRYAHALGRRGFEVEAVELIPHNIEIFKRNAQPGENVSVRQGNAMDLACFDGESFDITLLLGPLYHLYTEDDKLTALAEALRVTKRRGVIFAAYCISDPSILDYGFKQGHIFELIDKKLLETETFKVSSNPSEVFELVRREDIDRLMRGFAVTRLHYVAADGYTNHMRQTVDAMDDAAFELYIKYHFAVCERADMAGLTHHALDVFRKD